MIREAFRRLGAVTVSAILLAVGTMVWSSDRANAYGGFQISCTNYSPAPTILANQSPPLGVACDSHGNLLMTVSGSISATITFPFSGASDTQAAAAGQAVGLMVFNGTTWDRVTGTSGVINVAIPGGISLGAGTSAIGTVGITPSIASTDTMVQLDFSGGGTSGCKTATVYDGITAPANTSSTFCYIVKSSAGVLLQPTWDSLSSMVSLGGAGTDVVCRDGVDGTGNVVWQASAGAGQTANYKPFGRPFKRGLTCTANQAIPSSSGTNVLDMEIL